MEKFDIENLCHQLDSAHSQFSNSFKRIEYLQNDSPLSYIHCALALSVFEYSKDTTTLTYFFVRHVLYSLKHRSFINDPDYAIAKYEKVIDYQKTTVFHFADRAMNQLLHHFFNILNSHVEVLHYPLCATPPALDFVEPTLHHPAVKIDGRCLTIHANLNTALHDHIVTCFLPPELGNLENVHVVPLEIRCISPGDHEYFVDAIIPRWAFLINGELFIHPAMFRIMYHIFPYGKFRVYTTASENNVLKAKQVLLLRKYCNIDGEIDFPAMIQDGIPIRVVDMHTHCYLHAHDPLFQKNWMPGLEETRQWLRHEEYLKDDCDDERMQLSELTMVKTLKLRHDHNLLQERAECYEPISTDLIRHFQLFKFKFDGQLPVQKKKFEAAIYNDKYILKVPI